MNKLALVLALAAGTAHAQQAKELNVQRGPASELYIRKRPPAPEAPVLNAELKKLLTDTEKRRDDKRLEAIGLLRAFLDPPCSNDKRTYCPSKPDGEGRAEGMFKLAELL